MQRRYYRTGPATLPSNRNADFITQQDLCGAAFPASITTCGDEEATRWVDIQLRNCTGAMTGDDEEGNS